MNSNTFYANRSGLLGAIFIVPLFTFIFFTFGHLIENVISKPLFILGLVLNGIMSINPLLAKIIINQEGITYSTFFRKILIRWDDIQIFGAYKELRGLESLGKLNSFLRLYIDDLEVESKYDNIFEKIYLYRTLYLFISTKPDFMPNNFDRISKSYIKFDYTPKILEEIQKWLLMLNKNV